MSRPRVLGDDSDSLKLVMAVIRPERLTAVKQSLAEIGSDGLTVTNVSGRGSQPVEQLQWRGEEYTVDLHEKVKIECVVAANQTDEVVATIEKTAHTGEAGDGKIFVLPVGTTQQIRTADRGTDAL